MEVARQAPLSMGFSRQEYWSGLPFPPPGDLPDPGIEPTSPALQADSLPLSHWGRPIPAGYICSVNICTVKVLQKRRSRLVHQLAGHSTISTVSHTELLFMKFD